MRLRQGLLAYLAEREPTSAWITLGEIWARDKGLTR